MSLVQFPRTHRHAQAPILALMDLQQEYVAEGRAYFIEGLDECLHNCGRLLEAARGRGLPVAHFRQLLPGPYFNECSALSAWIEQFRPQPSEAVYQRDVPSGYSSEFFQSFMEAMEQPEVFLAGLSADRSCLSTIIHAVHLGHRVTFVADASASEHIGARSAGDSHAFMIDLISEYCDVVCTDDVLDRFSHADPRRWRAMGG